MGKFISRTKLLRIPIYNRHPTFYKIMQHTLLFNIFNSYIYTIYIKPSIGIITIIS